LRRFADITPPYGAVPAFAKADVDKKALKALGLERCDIGVQDRARVVCAGYRKLLGFARIYIRRKGYERLAQFLDRVLVARASSLTQRGECKDENNGNFRFYRSREMVNPELHKYHESLVNQLAQRPPGTECKGFHISK